MSESALVTILVFLPIVIFSVIIHEISHGLMALALGDKTAKNMGRLSLNPLKHADFFGSLILPIITFFIFKWPIGYAKPVPIDPRYFKNQRQGMTLTSLAGPLSNFGLALLGVLLFKAITDQAAAYIFQAFIIINMFLGLLNLLPIPPLDGSKVLMGIMPRKWLGTYYKNERYGIFIVLILVLLFPHYVSQFLWLIIGPILNLLGV